MKISSPFTGCLVAAMAAAAMLSAEEVQMKAQRVSLFKNGYACLKMQGTLPQGTKVEVKDLPMPIFGTLDWAVPEGVQVTHFVARKAHDSIADSPETALLGMYVGKEVKIFTKSKREYKGVLVGPTPPQPAPKGAFCTSDEERPLPQESCPVITLRTAEGKWIALSDSSIAGIELTEPTQMPAMHRPAAELSMELAAPAAGSPLQVEMVAHGLSWLPTYRLELNENKQARLIGKVSVINRLLDLEGVELELITGNPALGEGLVTSPLVRLVNLSTFLRALQQDRDWVSDWNRYSRSSDVYRSKRMAVAMPSGVMADDDMAMEEAPAWGEYGGLGGGSSTRTEDLTYYTVPSFSCKRGEVVECELFDITVPYRHVYTCDLPDQRVLQSAARSERSVADVWHCVRLTNTGELPWSMGIISGHSGDRFAARSTLPFTAVGQESLLRLSKTLESVITCREELAENGGYNKSGKAVPSVYRGQVTLTNHSDRPMEMELSKAIIGTPTEASDAGKISVTPAYSGNPRAVISWKLRLEPRQEKTCTYTYQYLND